MMFFGLSLRHVLVILFCFFPLVSHAQIKLVASIPPLGFVAQYLALPEDKVEVLVRAGRSPHHYQLKVSERQLLQDADIVLWVGEGLELFLKKPIKTHKNVVTALSLEGLTWPRAEMVDDGHGHDHGHQDPHLWLNPRNLMVVAEAVAEALAEASPANKQAYQDKLKTLQAELLALDEKLKASLSPLADKSFVIFHPAYGHFVEHYGLSQPHFLRVTPERGLGAKHLFHLRTKVKASCVFGEYQQDEKSVLQLAEAIDAKVGTLDPLGGQLGDKAHPGAIVEALAQTFADCFSAEGS